MCIRDRLYIDRSIDINSSLKQFFHILIPFGMAAAWDIAVRQLVHQKQLGMPSQRSIQVKLPQADSPVVYF